MYDTPLVLFLKRAGSILNREKIPYALTGTYAAWARGGAVLSDHDADFLILEQDYPRVLALFEAEGYRIEIPPAGWLVKVFDDSCETQCMIDFIFVSSAGPVTAEVLDDSDELRVFAVPMRVLSANKLLIHKLLALGVHSCDMVPLLIYTRALFPEIQWDVVREATQDSPYASAFLHLADRLNLTS